MLLINFFKKASVSVMTSKGCLLLMLFLFRFMKIKLVFISFFLFSISISFSQGSNTFHSSIQDDVVNNLNPNTHFYKLTNTSKEHQLLLYRVDIAEKNLIIQKRNAQVYGLIGLALVLMLIGYLFYKQQKLKNDQLLKENELKDALLKIETQSRLQEQRLRISRDLHDNIGAQLTFIISSIDNLKYGFDIKDEKLTAKLNTISNFTSSTI